MNVPHGKVTFAVLGSLILVSANDELYIWNGGRDHPTSGAANVTVECSGAKRASHFDQ